VLSAYRLPISFDLERLKNEIPKALAQGRWVDHWADSIATPGTWTVLALIAGAGDFDEATSRRLSSEASPHPTLILAELPAFREAIESFRTKVLRARLMRLKAGATINEHRDFAYFGSQRWSFERGRIRVHVPIVTDDGVTWKLRRRSIAMAAGEAWYVNVCLPHSVENRGTMDRINLVLELEVNDWLRKQFPAESWRERLWNAILREIEPHFWRVANVLMRRWRGAPVTCRGKDA
jgi:hypothetical protein